MKEAATPAGGDPRQPSAARQYVPPTVSAQDMPFDYAGFLAVVFGITGVMFRVLWIASVCKYYVSNSGTRNKQNQVIQSVFAVVAAIWMWFSPHIQVLLPIAAFPYKLCSWLAIIFCAQSLANMKNLETDLKQFSMAMMFAIMGLGTNYFGPNRAANSQR